MEWVISILYRMLSMGTFCIHSWATTRLYSNESKIEFVFIACIRALCPFFYRKIILHPKECCNLLLEHAGCGRDATLPPATPQMNSFTNQAPWGTNELLQFSVVTMHVLPHECRNVHAEPTANLLRILKKEELLKILSAIRKLEQCAWEMSSRMERNRLEFARGFVRVAPICGDVAKMLFDFTDRLFSEGENKTHYEVSLFPCFVIFYSDEIRDEERVQSDRAIVLALLAASAIMTRAQKVWRLSVRGPREDT